MRGVGVSGVVALLVVAQLTSFGLLVTPVAAAGTEYVVDPSGAGDYTRIQDALDATVDGDTVRVEPGTYAEQLSVSTNVSLVAPNGATLDGSGIAGDTVGIAVDPALSSGLTIEGFAVTGYTDGVTAGASAGESYDDASETSITGGWVIRDVVSSNNAEDGLDIGAALGTGWTLRNVSAHSNGDDGIEVGGFAGGTEAWRIRSSNASANDGYGVRVSSTSGSWELLDSATSDNRETGLYVSGTSGTWTIGHHNASGNSFNGIDVAGGDGGGWVIHNTTASDNSGFGIGNGGGMAGNWVIRDSVVNRNFDYGLYAPNAPGDFRIRNLTARDNSKAGVVTSDTAGNWRLDDSTIEDNGDASSSIFQVGIYAQGTTGAWVVNGSSITGNAEAGIDATNADVTGDALDNWWGQSTGPNQSQCVGNVDCSSPLTSDPDASTPTTAGVQGTVTNATGDPLSGIDVTVYRDDGSSFVQAATGTTKSDGTYSVDGIDAAGGTAALKLEFAASSAAYATEWYDDADSKSTATPVTVSAGTTESNLDAQLATAPPAVVEGTVRNASGDALSGIDVTVYRDDGGGTFSAYDTATTDASGGYAVEVEPPVAADERVPVQVRFRDPTGTYATEWHDDADRNGAKSVTLTRGFRTTLIGTTLVEARTTGGSDRGSSDDDDADSDPDPATFSGRVTDGNGDPIEGIEVAGFRDGGNGTFVGVATDDTDADGRYTVEVEPPDGDDTVTARLRFTDRNWTYAQRWYDARTELDAETFTVREGSGRVHLNTTMEANVVTVAGSARSTDGDSLEDIRVMVYRRGDDGRYRPDSGSLAYTDEFGQYDTTVAVPDGETTVDLKVRFSDSGDDYATTYWRNGTTWDDAESFNATAGWELPNVRVEMPEWEDVAAGYGGTVLNETGSLENILVTVYRDDGTGTFREWTNLRTDEAGYWETRIVPPDGEQTVSVKIRYRDETGRYLEEWEFDEPNRSAAEVTNVSVGDSALLYGTELEPAPATQISGVVFNESNDVLEGIEVTLYRKNGPGPSEAFATATTDEFGYYAFDVPAPPGESTVETRLHFDDPTGEYAQAWYLDERRWANATPMTNSVGSADRHNFQTLRKAGMLLDVWVQPLSTCQDPTDEDSCTFPNRDDTVTAGPNETVAIRYELWNGDDRVYRDYDVDDPATRTTMFGAGHEIVPGDLRSKTETLTAPIVDGTYDYQANATSDTRNGVVSNSTATYTIEVSGSVARQVRLPDGFSAVVSNSQAGEPVLVGVDDGVTAANGTTMQSLLLRTDGGSYTLNVTGDESAPDGTEPLPPGPGRPAFGYLTVGHSISDAAIENVTFRFRIDRFAHSRAGTSPTDVTLYRYVNGSPRSLPTSVVRVTSTGYVYEATSPGLSVFAVGTANLNLTNAPPAEEPATTASGGTGTSVGSPGFTPALTLLALLVAALLVSRRR